ncbi:hypothetical protein SAY87_020795 [Trapa incisa]|uniref:Uncharacterized protein n=1 Tax=Trapa incisa TaxID=236973 RepID=A0AAN7PN98_9MYRT|nr:hypothetical protein SAY87_020795 [Trapa incisa]
MLLESPGFSSLRGGTDSFLGSACMYTLNLRTERSTHSSYLASTLYFGAMDPLFSSAIDALSTIRQCEILTEVETEESPSPSSSSSTFSTRSQCFSVLQ